MFKSLGLGQLWQKNQMAVIILLVAGAVLALALSVRGLIPPALLKIFTPKFSGK